MKKKREVGTHKWNPSTKDALRKGTPLGILGCPRGAFVTSWSLCSPNRDLGRGSTLTSSRNPLGILLAIIFLHPQGDPVALSLTTPCSNYHQGCSSRTRITSAHFSPPHQCHNLPMGSRGCQRLGSARRNLESFPRRVKQK